MRTYADASMEAVNVRCMPQGEFRQLIREMVQENAMSRVLALLQEMQSSVEAAAAGTELLLNMELVQVQRVAATFIRIIVEGDLTPESDEGRHLIELTLGTRAQIPTGYMVKTLRSQSTCDSNMPSDQMLSTF